MRGLSIFFHSDTHFVSSIPSMLPVRKGGREEGERKGRVLLATTFLD